MKRKGKRSPFGEEQGLPDPDPYLPPTDVEPPDAYLTKRVRKPKVKT